MAVGSGKATRSKWAVACFQLVVRGFPIMVEKGKLISCVAHAIRLAGRCTFRLTRVGYCMHFLP